jgi:membrane protease YdiL (CAAX protease family)
MKRSFHLRQGSAPDAIFRSLLFWIIFMLLHGASGTLMVKLPGQWQLSRSMTGVFGAASAFFVTWLFVRKEKRSFRDIGLVWERNTLFRLAGGIAVGTVVFLLMVFFLLNAGELSLLKNEQGPGVGSIIPYLSIIPFVLMEEVAFRAYPLLTLNIALKLRVAQLIVAIAFAAYHLPGGGGIYAALAGPFIWAFVFGLAAVWSGGIAVPRGIHLALNVLQGLFGMKGGLVGIWRLDRKPDLSKMLMARAETVGLLAQSGVLVVAIVLMEWYIRRYRKRPDPS